MLEWVEQKRNVITNHAANADMFEGEEVGS